MTHDQASVQRSWTADENDGSGKWLPVTILSLLLIAGLGLFAWYVWPRSAPQTFAAAIAIAEYDEAILPQPAFPKWDLQQLIGSFPNRGLSEWKLASSTSARVRSELEQGVLSLDEELKKLGMSDRDTAVVYLRGHALVLNGEAYLITDGFTRSHALHDASKEMTADSPMVPLVEILEQLQDLPAGNVILLADICDLTTSPNLGVIANHVPEVLEKALRDVRGWRPLWVITSTAAMQPAHNSYVRQRTLLQSACEYACDTKRKHIGSSMLSLAGFYEAILRYSHNVTEGTQTPLLMRSGVRGHVLDSGPNQKIWQEATEVRIAKTVERIQSENSESSEGEPDTTAQRKASNGRLVALIQEDSADDMPLADAADESPPQAPPEETSPWLRFWQLRDRLQDRSTSPDGWAPVDWSVLRWRKMELDASRLARLHRIGSPNAVGDMRQWVEELETLNRQWHILDRPTSANNSLLNTTLLSDTTLLDGWRSLRQELSPSSARQPWSRPDVLPDAERVRWLPIRANYRIYMSALSQTPGWLARTLRHRYENRDQTQRLAKNLISAIVRLDRSLPSGEANALLDHPLNPTDAAAAQSALDALVRDASEQADQVFQAIENAKVGAAASVTWHAERRLQLLLEDTCLRFADRKKLEICYDSMTLANLDEPGTNGNLPDQRKPLSEMVEAGSVNGPQSALFGWCNMLRDVRELASEQTLPPVGGDSAPKLNAWGRQHLVEFEKAEPPTLRWKQVCLNDPQRFADTRQSVGTALLASVSLDTTIDVMVPRQHRLTTDSGLQTTLDLRVKRRNGTRIDNCYLQWNVATPAGFTGNPRQLLQIRSRSELAPDTPHQVRIEDGVIALNVVSELDRDRLTRPLQLQIQIAESMAELESSSATHRIAVSPPNPDRVELFARCLNPALRDDGLILPEKTPDGMLLRGLRVPAVGGQAKSRYAMFLANLSDQDKTVRAALYPVLGRPTLGDGSIDPSSATRTLREIQKGSRSSLSPAMVSQTIVLPANTGSGSNAGLPANNRRIVFGPPEGQDELQVPPRFGEFGLLCVIHEVEVDTEQRVSIKKNVDPSYRWIECRPDNPSRELVLVEPQPAVDQFVLNFSVQPQDWARWDLDEIKIVVEVTDTNGESIAVSGRNSIVLEPDPTQPSTASLRLTPQKRTTEKLVAHVHIGGFPRAIAFESRLEGRPGEVTRTSQAFIWLDLANIECLSRRQEQTIRPLSMRGNELVIPANEDVDDQSLGTETELSEIQGRLRVDFPKNGLRETATLSLDNFKMDISTDRQFFPGFELEEGNLVLSAMVNDIQYEIPAIEYNFAGRVPLEVEILEKVNQRSDVSLRRTAYLIFDQLPPERSSVLLDARELYDEETLRVEIDVVDADSAVSAVYFAIDRGDLLKNRFDESDILHLKADKFDDVGVWNNSWTAEELRAKKLGPGEYRVVCRTVDAAGNVQDSHAPARFRWKGTKRPVSKPRKKPVLQSKPTSQTPPQPTEFTVYVEVTVNGKAPAYPQKTSVSGVPGARETNNRGIWTFTKVPEGAHEVTATYTDPFGVVFSGKGRVQVPGATRITVDTQR